MTKGKGLPPSKLAVALDKRTLPSLKIPMSTTFTGLSGSMIHSYTKGLANALSKFKFVTSLILWYNIFFEINLTNKQLQEKNFDIHSIQKLAAN